jgi:hypothetical protein
MISGISSHETTSHGITFCKMTSDGNLPYIISRKPGRYPKECCPTGAYPNINMAIVAADGNDRFQGLPAPMFQNCECESR